MENHLIPLHRNLTVFLAAGETQEPVAQAAARLAVRGPVTLLDGANRAPAYRLVRLICSLTPEPEAALQRIIIRRAFTCHQFLALLEGQPALPQPSILLDPLATFYDEQIPGREAERLLDGCLRQVERLCQAGPVLAALRPARLPERAALVERFCERADHLVLPELLLPQPAQPGLL